MRYIFHVDMDAFFASVEIARNPALQGKPVIVGGSPDRRGVVSTCSYEARAFGVHSAMSLSEAYRLCPHGVFLEGNFDVYREYSQRITNIFYQYTPFVEVVSIDEAYIDATTLINEEITPIKLATTIRQQVLSETKLTCSIGVASNKLIAKVASSKAKPKNDSGSSGILIIPAHSEAKFLAPLSIQALPGIGPKTQHIFNRQGINTIEDLQAISLDELIQQHGSWGHYYYFAARGEDNRPVAWEDSPPKSISAETTFERDQTDLSLLTEELSLLLSKTHRRLLAHKMRTKRLSIKLRFTNFKTITRSQTLITHFNDFNTLQKAALELFYQNYNGSPPLRLVGITLERLSNTYWQPTWDDCWK